MLLKVNLSTGTTFSNAISAANVNGKVNMTYSTWHEQAIWRCMSYCHHVAFQETIKGGYRGPFGRSVQSFLYSLVYKDPYPIIILEIWNVGHMAILTYMGPAAGFEMNTATKKRSPKP